MDKEKSVYGEEEWIEREEFLMKRRSRFQEKSVYFKKRGVRFKEETVYEEEEEWI